MKAANALAVIDFGFWLMMVAGSFYSSHLIKASPRSPDRLHRHSMSEHGDVYYVTEEQKNLRAILFEGGFLGGVVFLSAAALIGGKAWRKQAG